MRVNAYSAANGHEFSHIESPFAEFEFRYECLALTDALAEFKLRDASIPPRLNQPLDNSSVEVGSKRGHIAAPVEKPTRN